MSDESQVQGIGGDGGGGGGGGKGGELSERVTLKDGLCEMMALVESGLLTYQLFSQSS